jgi:hypothetical protein
MGYLWRPVYIVSILGCWPPIGVFVSLFISSQNSAQVALLPISLMRNAQQACVRCTGTGTLNDPRHETLGPLPSKQRCQQQLQGLCALVAAVVLMWACISHFATLVAQTAAATSEVAAWWPLPDIS